MAPIKSSLARSASKLFGVFRDRDLSLRGATSSIKNTISFQATGGTKITSGSYDYHVFTSSSTLVVDGTGPATILVIAAGGSGGAGFSGNGEYGGGGGGAGGIAYAANVTVTGGTHTVTVGSPAPNLAGGPQNSGGPAPQAAGGSSAFGHNGSSAEFPYGVLVGGGTPGGTSGNNPPADPFGGSAASTTGGSTGGSGARNNPGRSAGNSTESFPGDWTPYGNKGGDGGFPQSNAAGGGGAGSAGS